MKSQHTITSLPPSPDEERRARMVKYTIAMSIRVVCIVLMLFVQGWWLVVCAAGAIFLPYIAVVLANVGTQRGGEVAAPTLALTAGGADDLRDDVRDPAGSDPRPAHHASGSGAGSGSGHDAGAAR
ncbi:DUF3099 domain-containing protein [Agromyces larvae]|uniref:DUF3099 domain-containing protein n=1 Tax=Agromyces larvae TaxID=2929802 RepID=A0ABY4C154_9MICO|nr:DUF3099 domain-containing protein [Agromyces larvae]UOE45123.1 DUF3099 domain-containing protein [Agromyces larvae]